MTLYFTLSSFFVKLNNNITNFLVVKVSGMGQKQAEPLNIWMRVHLGAFKPDNYTSQQFEYHHELFFF